MIESMSYRISIVNVSLPDTVFSFLKLYMSSTNRLHLDRPAYNFADNNEMAD